MTTMSDNRPRKGSSRSRSPLRAAYDAIRNSTTKSPTRRNISPGPRARSQEQQDVAVTASITKMKTVEDEGTNKKVITLKLGTKDAAGIFNAEEGTMVSFSNKRCRLVYDPEASGDLRVALLPAGTFQVASSNPSAGTLKVIIEKGEANDDDTMQAFLFQEAKVGSSFTLSYD